MKLFTVILLIFIMGCIYQTPQAQEISIKEYNSTGDLYDIEENEEAPYQELKIKTSYPETYVIKAVESIYDECGGCLDYVSSTASALRRYDKSVDFNLIVSVSGALRLTDRNNTLGLFLIDRIPELGFKTFFASSTVKLNSLIKFYNKYEIDAVALEGGSLSFLKSIMFSGVVPVIALDTVEIVTSVAKNYGAQNQDNQPNEVFFTVVGYGPKMKVNDPTGEDHSTVYMEIDVNEFLDAWKNTNNNYGERFVYFVLKDSDPISVDNSINIIVDDLELSHFELLNTKYEDVYRQGKASRLFLSLYLSDISSTASQIFLESSRLFDSENIEISKIIELEKEGIKILR